MHEYIYVKTARPNVWKMKHLVIWEAAHGPVPEGHRVIFADRDKTNFALENLILVTKGELAVMNRFGLIFPDKELTKTGKAVAELQLLTGRRKREAKKGRKPGTARAPGAPLKGPGGPD
ncbi:MAG: HNH endonuclease [Treponema sp.]|nr:HNH endonuclease [Treponema sp.]